MRGKLERKPQKRDAEYDVKSGAKVMYFGLRLCRIPTHTIGEGTLVFKLHWFPKLKKNAFIV